MQEIITNHVSIEYGILVLLLCVSTICLSIKIYKKEMILKGAFLSILIVSFFSLIVTINEKSDLDDLTVYLSSMGFGVILLLVISIFTSWDEESNI